jgi:CubicO group peptidase (beta-lactamase class C family)
MASYPLDFEPGTRWSYTNTAYPLLGMVATAAAGKPYHDLVAERIFAPLGMTATRFSRPEEIVPQRASGYVEQDGRLRKGELLRPRVLEPNGGIMSTVLDLAKWERALREPALLKAASLAEMETITKLSNGQGTPVGLGLFIDSRKKHRLFVHNGSTPGGFSSVFYHWPEDQITVIVLCNIDRDDAVNRVATHVAGLFVPGLDLFAK